jgi:putative phosphoesterase
LKEWIKGPNLVRSFLTWPYSIYSMKRIGLISDTHAYTGADVADYLSEVDEIWHAGDIGPLATVHFYEGLGKPFRAVYGNIDDHLVQRTFPEVLAFSIEGLQVIMIHIGGYPGRYTAKAREAFKKWPCDLFISGHSHITKVMRDPKLDLIHMNPGACGQHGFHGIRTLIRFSVENGKIFDVEVVELGRRGKIQREK